MTVIPNHSQMRVDKDTGQDFYNETLQSSIDFGMLSKCAQVVSYGVFQILVYSYIEWFWGGGLLMYCACK